jgi:hypothetical protein
MPEIARTRQDLAQLMDQVMNQTYSSLEEDQELELETSLVKTYMLESHLTEDASPQQIRSTLQTVSETPLARNRKLVLDDTRDPTLFHLSTVVDRERVILYIDVSNPRFWLLHSANRSTALDWILDRVTKEQDQLDRGWLWPELLQELSTKGSFRGLGLDYDRRLVPDVDFESPESVEYLKLQLWGMQASKVLQVLQDSFPHATTLAKVKVKYWLSQSGDGDFSLDDVKFDGKITARGTSFQSHLALVAALYRRYSDTIRRLEAEFSLKWEHEGEGLNLSGSAISFRFPKPIQDLTRFCDYVFSSSLPFRLWGIPTLVSKSLVRVPAVDLHSSSRLDVEVSPDFMRLYLPEGSCGNTILRLYTNLKHHYDSRLTAVSADGENVL